MFEAGDLEQLNIPPVESVTPIDSSTQDARKARLIQVLRLRGRSSFNRDLDLARALASNLNLACASDLARKVYPDLDQDLTSDLSEADLNGANLRYINLTGADLTGADLTYADVTGTIFGNNPGLTEADKRDLQSREAIFQAPPSSDVPALVLR